MQLHLISIFMTLHVNTIIYKGNTVLAPQNLKPFYVNSTIAKNGRLKGLYRDNCMEDRRTCSALTFSILRNFYLRGIIKKNWRKNLKPAVRY